jgi:hypothetical protein
MTKQTVRAWVLLAVFSALPVMSADAATILFTDRTSFETATGATGVGAIPQGLGPFSLGPLSFQDQSGSSMAHDRDWSTLISENFDLAVSGLENYNVVSSSVSLFAFGFDFHEPSLSTPPGPQFPDTCNTTCVESTFQMSILNGAVLVGTSFFSMPNDVLTFIGISSTDPFDRIEIREVIGTNDNEFFGNFLIARESTVPEPSLLAMLGIGLFALAARRFRN